MANIFTIGYATMNNDDFINILKVKDVHAVVDIRSTPYSKTFPFYNANNLKRVLKANNISYLSFDKEFGARREENQVYSKGYDYEGHEFEFVDFYKVWVTDVFKSGIERIKIGLNKNLNICLLCSEKYSYECHRGLMVSEYIYKYLNYDVFHIIDINNGFYHKYIYQYFLKKFNEEKIKFIKKNKQLIQYNGNLFNDEKPDYIEFWFNIFNKENIDNIFYLNNILIAYRKGEDSND